MVSLAQAGLQADSGARAVVQRPEVGARSAKTVETNVKAVADRLAELGF